MDIGLQFTEGLHDSTIYLPASKSISNRVLIINALAASRMPVQNLAECDDTDSMLRVLSSEENHFDIGHAGTAMRFLTAYLSGLAGTWEITGSERMKQRPIAVLVDTLNALGACIEYIEREGFPPLRIHGSGLVGGEIQTDASVSSQYISALMMVAPYMANGLSIRLKGKIVSRTYIDMTAGIMQQFGGNVSVRQDCITISAGAYTPVDYSVESDWTAASYFYELLAIAGGGEITLPGLLENSLQGDAGQARVWKQLGVTTYFNSAGAILTGGGKIAGQLEYDFIGMPDIVQSFTVACCIMGVPFCFSGVETLRIKETDRIYALHCELCKLGYAIQVVDDSRIRWDGARCGVLCDGIATYHDHRMAMAFAPAAIKHPGLILWDKDVVTKSFPRFWQQLENCGASFS